MYELCHCLRSLAFLYVWPRKSHVTSQLNPPGTKLNVKWIHLRTICTSKVTRDPLSLLVPFASDHKLAKEYGPSSPSLELDF